MKKEPPEQFLFGRLQYQGRRYAVPPAPKWARTIQYEVVLDGADTVESVWAIFKGKRSRILRVQMKLAP